MTYQLILGDCIEGMRAMADKSVDVVCSDPPYSEHVHKSARTMAGMYRDTDEMQACSARRLELGFNHLTSDDLEAIATQYGRLTKRWALVFSDTESAHLWREAMERAGLQYVRTCFWHRLAGAPQFTGDRPAVSLEAITACATPDTAAEYLEDVVAITCCHQAGRKRWNGGGKQGLYPFPIVQSSKNAPRLHTTQKPVDLMRALISDFTNPGELVLDSHAGSGTTGAACIELGRDFIGFEKDPKHHAIATARLARCVVDIGAVQRQGLLALPKPKQLTLSSDLDLP